jgi:hypothetical protein
MTSLQKTKKRKRQKDASRRERELPRLDGYMDSIEFAGLISIGLAGRTTSTFEIVQQTGHPETSIQEASRKD